MPAAMSGIRTGQPVCNVCNENFDNQEKMVNSNGQLYHENCFVSPREHAQDMLSKQALVDNHSTNQQSTNHAFVKLLEEVQSILDNNGYACSVFIDLQKAFDTVNHKVWSNYRIPPTNRRCAQCFRPFEDGLFFEFDGRQYCEYCFQQLYAPCCRGCGEYIIGRVIKAMNGNWHPECFRCEICDDSLADAGFVKNAGRALCKRCNANEKSKGGRFMCHKCHTYIEEGKHIIYMGDPVHPWHYNCYECGRELDETCRKRQNELYCLRCHDKMGIPICGACKQPIEDERVVNAIGKQWHVDHFCCAKCEKPFYGNRHYEKNGLAYCETHFNQLFGDICFICNRAITRDVVTALNKCFCVHHFICTGCNVKLTLKSKFHELDMKPLCLRCHEKLPKELRKRLKKAESASR